MSASVRCPYCGGLAATRIESVCVYAGVRAGPLGTKGRLLQQTDRYQCEVCRREWDEESFPARHGGCARPPAALPAASGVTIAAAGG
jgi:hypothetical protein